MISELGRKVLRAKPFESFPLVFSSVYDDFLSHSQGLSLTTETFLPSHVVER